MLTSYSSWAVVLYANLPGVGERRAGVFTGGPGSPAGRGELFDVMASTQLGDRRVKRASRAGDQLSELLLVMLVAGGGNQKDHAGRTRARVGECVRAAARDIHDASWPAAGHRGPGVGLP